MNIVLGITGSIAAYKACQLIRLFVKAGHEVQVVITPAGKEFITPITLSALTSKPVVSEFFSQRDGSWHSHVALGQWADAMVIAPATASSIAKMANGVADNMLITTYLSMKAPVFVAPAMDLDMYAHPTTQANLQTLRDNGNYIIEPGTGFLASHLEGKGRMEEPEEIFRQVMAQLETGRLAGRRVLITAGPTYEKIDPVRFIGNYSSGKMGFALAEAAAAEGADVELIAGPVALTTQHPRIHRTDVESAQQMYDAAQTLFPQCSDAILCAAVADYRPAEIADQKIKREGEESMTLHLVQNPDIAAALGAARQPGQKLIGFALETADAEHYAADKLKRKNLDYIVVNSLQDEGAGFGVDTNKVTLIAADGSQESVPLASKKEVAQHIIRRLLTLLCCLSFVFGSASAQELNARVKINTQQVQGTSTSIFEALERNVTEFLNNQQWTNLQFQRNERIDCNFNIVVKKYEESDHLFTASLIVQANRPVYGASYTTISYSITDLNFNFEFEEFDQLNFRIDLIDKDLTALLAYYAYMIIGMDMDTMSPLGGTEVLRMAQTITQNAQSLTTSAKGWKAFDDYKNRYGIINDYLDAGMEPMRRLMYKYHREGLDVMAENVDRGRAAILECFDLLEEAHLNKTMSMVPQVWTDYKRDEIANIFKGKGTSSEKAAMYETLMKINTSQSAYWNQLK